VASKAARIVEAAAGRKVVDFGFRRAPTPEAAHLASRAAYIAGFDATSNLEGGRRYGIPMIGTVPYSFVLAFQSEQDALRKYARAFPEGALVLIDSYNQEETTREVIACGEKLRGVRISSKALLELSRDVRGMLDGSGNQETEIIASGELNENKIATLVQARAPIDFFGVGADLVSGNEMAMVEGIYRLVEVEEKVGVRYPEKFFAGKETIPARKQILRKMDRSGRYRGDAIAKAGEMPGRGEVAYVRKVMEDGKLVDPLPPLKEIRRYCMEEMTRLPPGIRRIEKPDTYPVKVSRKLLDLCARMGGK
jgi:nicotinate phosphoribosyltransferase